MRHGGDLTAAMAAFGGERADWLELSTGINPHAYPLPALPDGLWRALPSAGLADAFVAAARRAYGAPEGSELVAAPGTQSLIQWLPRLAPPGAVAILGPTYAEHRLAWQAAGVEVIDSAADDPFPAGARHLVVVNPNNPDGRLLPKDRLAALAAEAARRTGVLVVDESFVDVTPAASAAGLSAEAPVLVLRSFGKFYGLAGVRLGVLIAGAGWSARVAAALGPWAVSGPALAIGAAALRDEGWAVAMRARLAEEAAALDGVLSEAGVALRGGTSLYRLAHHKAASALHGALARRRVWVRRFDWDDGLLRFGLPPTAEARRRLGQALADSLRALGEPDHSGDHGSVRV
jgi:cobalamin biosynthetic protein CobC